MYALRICGVADIQCSLGCGVGPCQREQKLPAPVPAAEARELASILGSMIEGSAGDPAEIYQPDYSPADGDVYVARAAELLIEQQAEIDRLNAIINTPHTDNFLQAVSIEAEHQRQRWNDSNKAPADWFWLVGYLAGKALAAVLSGDHMKAKHHMVTTAAALANWHRTAAQG
jgi:hypothetical protein